jgi:hypothetical protein
MISMDGNHNKGRENGAIEAWQSMENTYQKHAVDNR